jgi:hypothetical protein
MLRGGRRRLATAGESKSRSMVSSVDVGSECPERSFVACAAQMLAGNTPALENEIRTQSKLTRPSLLGRFPFTAMHVIM